MINNTFEYYGVAIIIVRPGMAFEIEKCVTNMGVARLPLLDITVGRRALGELRASRTVSLPEGLEVVGDSWFVDSGVEEVIVPASVREIQKCAFACCEKLRSVEFVGESQLQSMGEYCFYNCGLTSITIPAGVAVI